MQDYITYVLVSVMYVDFFLEVGSYLGTGCRKCHVKTIL